MQLPRLPLLRPSHSLWSATQIRLASSASKPPSSETKPPISATTSDDASTPVDGSSPKSPFAKKRERTRFGHIDFVRLKIPRPSKPEAPKPSTSQIVSAKRRPKSQPITSSELGGITEHSHSRNAVESAGTVQSTGKGPVLEYQRALTFEDVQTPTQRSRKHVAYVGRQSGLQRGGNMNLERRKPQDLLRESNTISTPPKEPVAPSPNEPPNPPVPNLDKTKPSLSLLEELFPETVQKESPKTSAPPDREVPRLFLPSQRPIDLPQSGAYRDPRVQMRKAFIEAFESRGEEVTLLVLNKCNISLVESDFKRLIPSGKHIQGWARDGEVMRIIPGRDPRSLARLPFYLLLFKTPSEALAYQANVARIHKLARLHTPSSAISAIPPPPGLIEDGEDLHAVIQNYSLAPPGMMLHLEVVQQPYPPLWREIALQGGYKPIVDDQGKKLHKVLLHMEGYEVSRLALFLAIRFDAIERGLSSWDLMDGIDSIVKLEDLWGINRPRRNTQHRSCNRDQGGLYVDDNDESDETDTDTDNDTDDPHSQYSDMDRLENRPAAKQHAIHRVYNRWVIEFKTQDMAERFARSWHRRLLPLPREERERERMETKSWKEMEAPNVCNTEVLW
ncbi:hypothetical protein K432DRAFT_421107 [Lepidopterella palustris CBS 459.81]|uniref:Uncharacterized protein n=1 Tax=Lepidopterella palustris CBS 459.81 TaxID=1314670 RepID=A0A8E2ELV6_9PEZI|nr:hypothetical protein K432DRAFT_421107 [Lepidopterella palustris CBS 459.81]